MLYIIPAHRHKHVCHRFRKRTDDLGKTRFLTCWTHDYPILQHTSTANCVKTPHEGQRICLCGVQLEFATFQAQRRTNRTPELALEIVLVQQLVSASFSTCRTHAPAQMHAHCRPCGWQNMILEALEILNGTLHVAEVVFIFRSQG